MPTNDFGQLSTNGNNTPRHFPAVKKTWNIIEKRSRILIVKVKQSLSFLDTCICTSLCVRIYNYTISSFSNFLLGIFPYSSTWQDPC